MRVGCVIIILLFSFQGLVAQDSVKYKPYKILPVPTFGYQPETRTYIGAVALATLDFYKDKTRTSNASLEFSYTWNKQLIIEGDWNYFFRDEEWFTKGLLHYSKYPDFFYGTGNLAWQPISYSSRRWNLGMHLLKRIRKDAFFGPQLRFISFTDIFSLEEDLSSPTHNLLDTEDKSVFSLGLTFLLDKRDNILTPTKGAFVQFDFLRNFIDSHYLKYVLDLRKYWTVKKQVTLALRSYYQGNFGRQLPFFDMAQMGGDRYTRGFFYGKYRDKHFHTVQVEARAKVFWRIGVAGFGGFSRVAFTVDDFALSGYRYNVGGGLRIIVDKQEGTALRLDYAIGQGGNSGFYFAFGEAF